MRSAPGPTLDLPSSCEQASPAVPGCSPTAGKGLGEPEAEASGGPPAAVSPHGPRLVPALGSRLTLAFQRGVQAASAAPELTCPPHGPPLPPRLLGPKAGLWENTPNSPSWGRRPVPGCTAGPPLWGPTSGASASWWRRRCRSC